MNLWMLFHWLSLASLDELPELGDVVETESDEDIFATRYQEGDLSETD